MANNFDLILWTDKLDYAPGDTATFTVEGATVGGTIEFQVLHVTDPGADGVYGTLDDTLDAGPDGVTGTADDGYGTTGAGHEPFYVTDGVYEIDAGADGIVGTADDVIIGDRIPPTRPSMCGGHTSCSVIRSVGSAACATASAVGSQLLIPAGLTRSSTPETCP